MTLGGGGSGEIERKIFYSQSGEGKKIISRLARKKTHHDILSARAPPLIINGPSLTNHHQLSNNFGFPAAG